VAGCANPTVGNIVRGAYTPYSENHGRPVYRKNEQVNNLDVLIYYWDDRDGPNFCGWWFGPKVGGDQVWAYNSERAMTPPPGGWRVPYDGPVDTTFSVSSGSGGGGYAQQQPQQQAPQAPQGQYGQQQQPPQQQQQQGQYQQDLQAYYRKQEEDRLRQQQEAVRQQQEASRQQQQQQLLMQQQQAAQAKQREEDMRRQREAEMQRKREEDERRRYEQHAALTARKAIQKIRFATPENYEELKLEVEQTLAAELPKCGAQGERIRQDADTTVQQAQQRVEEIKEQRRVDEERKVEEEAATKKLMLELVELVNKAEQDVAKVKEVGAPVLEGAETKSELGLEEAKTLWESVTQVVGAAKASSKACTDFIVTNRATIEKAKSIVTETREELLKLQGRIQDFFKIVIKTSLTTKAIHEKAAKKAKAAKELERRSALFTKYSTGGVMSKVDIEFYAKREFEFSLAKEDLTKIFERFAVGKGVPKEKFQQLKLAVGIAREEEASRMRVKELAEKKAKLEELVGSVASSLEKVEPEVVKTEEKVKPLAAGDLTTVDHKLVVEAAEDTQEQLASTKTAINQVRKEIAEIGSDVEEALKIFLTLEVRKLDVKVNQYDLRLNQVGIVLSRGKAYLAREAKAELDATRAAAVQALKAHVVEKKLTLEELFAVVDKDKDEVVSKSEFLAFFAECSSDIEPEKLERFFAHLDEGEKGALAKDAFLRLARVYFIVVKETPMTAEMSIKESKMVRRLDAGEVLEVCEGPVKDDSGITRVKGFAKKDGAEGWATVQGNSGTIFLEEGEATYEVIKEVALTAEFEVVEGVDPVRMLQPGECVEVLEWDKKDEASGAVRMKVKVLAETGPVLMGYASKVSPEGSTCLKLKRS